LAFLGVLLWGGSLWRPAPALVVPYTVWVIGGCLIGGATAGLRALGAARRSLRAMIIASVLFLTCSGVGTYLDGATGAVVGAAAATMAAALVWWWQLRLGIQESRIFPAPAAADYLTGTGHSKGRHRRPATAARVP
jgi:O-antigen/teichoic acid export membrane protein